MKKKTIWKVRGAMSHRILFNAPSKTCGEKLYNDLLRKVYGSKPDKGRVTDHAKEVVAQIKEFVAKEGESKHFAYMKDYIDMSSNSLAGDFITSSYLKWIFTPAEEKKEGVALYILDIIVKYTYGVEKTFAGMFFHTWKDVEIYLQNAHREAYRNMRENPEGYTGEFPVLPTHLDFSLLYVQQEVHSNERNRLRDALSLVLKVTGLLPLKNKIVTSLSSAPVPASTTSYNSSDIYTEFEEIEYSEKSTPKNRKWAHCIAYSFLLTIILFLWLRPQYNTDQIAEIRVTSAEEPFIDNTEKKGTPQIASDDPQEQVLDPQISLDQGVLDKKEQSKQDGINDSNTGTPFYSDKSPDKHYDKRTTSAKDNKIQLGHSTQSEYIPSIPPSPPIDSNAHISRVSEQSPIKAELEPITSDLHPVSFERRIASNNPIDKNKRVSPKSTSSHYQLTPKRNNPVIVNSPSEKQENPPFITSDVTMPEITVSANARYVNGIPTAISTFCDCKRATDKKECRIVRRTAHIEYERYFFDENREAVFHLESKKMNYVPAKRIKEYIEKNPQSIHIPDAETFAAYCFEYKVRL